MRSRFTSAIAIVIACTAVVAAWQSRDTGSAALVGVIVTDTNDPQPIRRATVRLAGGAGTSARVLGTDDDGRFRFEALAAGTYTLSVTKPGYVPTFHGSKYPGRGPAVPIALAEGQRMDVAVRLLPGAAITGVVTDPQGNPAPGVPVVAVETRPPLGAALPAVRGTTDELGMYRIFGLAPGEYLVSATPQMVPMNGYGIGATSSAVAATTAADVQWARSLITGGGGAPPGQSQSRGVVAYAPVFYPGTTNAADAGVVRVAAGEERSGIGMSLRIVPVSRIAGTLIDANGQAITSATITLYPRRRDQPTPADSLVSSGALVLPRASVSTSGFVFTGVAPGEYTLVARTGGAQRGAPPPDGSQPIALWNVTDLVVDGNDRNDLSLRLMPGLSLFGLLAFERGKSVPPTDFPIAVSLVALNPIPGIASPRAVKKNDTFTFTSIPPGSYVVRAAVSLDPGQIWTLKSAVLNRRDLADMPIESTATGEEQRTVMLTMTDRGAEIAGRLLDASNQPVSRYSIVVFPTDKSLWLPHARRIRPADPAADGSFRIAGLPAGEYGIAAVSDAAPGVPSDPAFLSELLASAFKFTLAEGEKKQQDLRVAK